MKTQIFVQSSARQRGAVLLIALIVLVAMTLSALALIQSVNTTNLVSGNLAFREAAVLSAERATESAITDWLALQAGKSSLWSNAVTHGYLAIRADPQDGDWSKFWKDLPDDVKKSAPQNSASSALRADSNEVLYVIHRLCDEQGDPNSGINCSRPPRMGDGDSRAIPTTGGLGLSSSQVYYRITARVKGPRSTVVYTQTIVAL